MKRETLVEQHKIIAISYKKKREEFYAQLAELKSQFDLSPEQQREVDFGIITPADESLQKYNDVLNTDRKLNTLSEQLNDLVMKGCVEILKGLNENELYIPGYDVDEFIRIPMENRFEIKNLMLGFGGYRHIHTINDKILLEVPARNYLPKNRPLMKGIKFWLNTVKEFNME